MEHRSEQACLLASHRPCWGADVVLSRERSVHACSWAQRLCRPVEVGDCAHAALAAVTARQRWSDWLTDRRHRAAYAAIYFFFFVLLSGKERKQKRGEHYMAVPASNELQWGLTFSQ
eukprot:291286-Pelagomonas_calceolata.AAC.4